MIIRRSEAEEKILVKNVFKEFFEITLKDIRTNDNKTPDFYVLKEEKEVAYCELKSVNTNDILVRSGQLTITNDSTFNKIGNGIYEAAKQFKSAFKQWGELPCILVFLNYDSSINVNDLYSTVTGAFRSTDGKEDYIHQNISEGRIKELKNIIQLYIWLDVKINGDTITTSKPFLRRYKEAIPFSESLDDSFNLSQG